jgi:sirohydrochlorin ferrochelatase
MKGILLYGHGARNPEWAQPFHRIREAIKARDRERWSNRASWN